MSLKVQNVLLDITHYFPKTNYYEPFLTLVFSHKTSPKQLLRVNYCENNNNNTMPLLWQDYHHSIGEVSGAVIVGMGDRQEKPRSVVILVLLHCLITRFSVLCVIRNVA